MKRTQERAGWLTSLAILLGTAAPAWADAVAHWKLDESAGATTAADSVGSRHGTLHGSAAFVTGGSSGNCIHVTIAGGGYIDMGDVFRFTSGDFAIVAWARTAPGDRTPDYFILGKHRATIVQGYLLGINANGGYGQTDKAWFYQSNAFGSQSPISTTSVNDGAWHQIVAVYRAGGQTRMFVDGAPAEASIGAIPMGGNDAHLAIAGVDFGGALRAVLNGWVDDVQFYDHALTPNQVQRLFEQPGNTVIGPIGDMNCDRAVNFDDIDAFVLALIDESTYEAAFPGCRILLGDMNLDGAVNFDDIGDFVAALAG